MNKLVCLLAVLATTTFAQTATTQPNPVLWSETFDREGPVLRRVQLIGRINASPMPVDGKQIPGVSGRCYAATAQRGAIIRRAQNLPELPLKEASEFVFRIDPISATEATPVVIEAQFRTKLRRVYRGRKVRLTKPGWQEVRIPLRKAQPVADSFVSWDEAVNVALQFNTDCTIALDGLELRRGKLGPELSTTELARLAFGERSHRVFETSVCTVLTDAASLPETVTSEAIETLRGQMQADFPKRNFGKTKAHLIVFADEAAYRDFWPRLGDAWGRRLPKPTTDGHSANMVATTFRKPGIEANGIRPVLVHEAAHVLLSGMLGLQGGSWLLEGLATRYQIAFSQQDIGPVIRTGLSEAGRRLSLSELLKTNQLEPGRYWQAYVLVEFLLTAERRAPFVQVLGELRKVGTADMSTMLRKAWNLRPKPFEKAMLDWAAGNWAE